MSIIGVTGDFSLKHFIEIHKKLFGDVYFFAGEFRRENIAKGSFRFADYRYIENEIIKLFKMILKDNIILNNNIDKDMLAEKLAYYSAELNVLHPFREGNGRSQRLFIGDLAIENGYYLEWNNIPKEEMIQMSKNDNVKEVAKIFKENLKEVNQDLKIQNQLVQKIQARRKSKEQNINKGLTRK